MRKLTPDQAEVLRSFLVNNGLSFKPLQDEMVDHMSADLEDRMSRGATFEEAMDKVIGQIPDNHFQIIQKEIMETIDKRFTVSRVFSFVAVGLLLICTLFKVLHLQFADEVLLLSFTSLAASLLFGSLTGITLNKEKNGSVRLLAMVFGMVGLILGYCFKVLHLPGADSIIGLAVGLLIVSLIVNTSYVYRHGSGEGNLLTFLHKKHTPGIERFFLFLLIPMAIYKVMTIVLQQDYYVGNLVLLIVILGAGLQLIALSWRAMEEDLSKRNFIVFAAIIISSLCLTLVFLGPILSFEIRVMLIIVFSMVAAWLAYAIEERPHNIFSLIATVLVPLFFLGWGLIKLNVLPPSSHGIFFNLPVMFILSLGLYTSKKHGTMRAFLLVSLSSYILEYMR
jgi:hypothetical protein